MAEKRTSEIEFESFESLFGSVPENTDGIVMLNTALLVPFANHPFQVRDDEDMENLMESTACHGVLVPLLVREKEAGRYEIISGHRRKYACDRLNIRQVPVLIREYTDDEAIIIMVDSNIQREHLLFSEKAFALRMKLEAMNRQGARTDLTSGQNEGKSEKDMQSTSGQNDGKSQGVTSATILGKDIGKSESTVRRLIRLTYLIQPILELVDEKKMSLSVGESISYLAEDEQKMLFGYMQENSHMLSGEEAKLLKRASESGELDEARMQDILSGSKEKAAKPASISLKSKRLYEYFPPDYSRQQMEEVIFSLLLDWKKKNQVKM